MKIIAGKFRGKKMIEYFNDTTRPTTARVRENIFNVLGSAVDSAAVLDLFAGTGLYGVEAISRGASLVFFNDADPAAVSVIRKNLGSLKQHDCKTNVMNEDAFTALEKLKSKHFDIVFLDPPYDTNMGERAVEYIMNQNMLAHDGIIVFETDTAFTNPDFHRFNVRIKEYGRAKIYFIKEATKP